MADASYSARESSSTAQPALKRSSAPASPRLHEAWDLPLPGSGATAARHMILAAIGREDLGTARVAEAHASALAILAEAGRSPRPQALYGLWTADGASTPLRAERIADLGWRLHGLKDYCGGATLVDACLVTAASDVGMLLFDIEMGDRVQPQPSRWKTHALEDAAVRPVSFDLVLDADSLIGPPDWFLRRCGYWHGTLGAAACWAGGALSLIDAVRKLQRAEPHARAHLGALEALDWNLRLILQESGREIDADPKDAQGRARVRALMARHLVQRACSETIDRLGRATGTQLLAFDAQVAKQHAALGLWIRECQAERDLEGIPPMH